ncbi:tyrosine-type recombinase/integrase [Paraburkholderia caffeinilytica]|uniref:tyrosine-type recombinase/integrase n=1 Tax=Paraburkholderia caffeinilytica TaxID=1761016 RepID=UPI003D9FE20F
MRLRELVETYIAYKRSLGMRFRTDANILRAFCRTVGDIGVDDVTGSGICLHRGTGPVTASWRCRASMLGGLYRYALARSFAIIFPLPTCEPKLPPPVAPYVYSVSELERMLTATDMLKTQCSPLQAASMRTLLLLLYGSGMRISEALKLTLHDVDLLQQPVTVRETKFFKTRLAPIGPRLCKVLADYECRRRCLPLPDGENSAFFASRTGRHWQVQSVRLNFRRLRRVAGLRREDSTGQQPRIHDLRHTAAVHRLVYWYRADLDVQRLLPQLATYLGHVHIRSTQRYLTMTADLLREANLRFEQYATPEIRHE